MLEEHPDIERECTECDYTTLHQRDLQKHINLHHGDDSSGRVFYCSQCDYQTTVKTQLYRHTARAHRKAGKKLFSCNACSYASAVRDEVEQHMLEDHQDIAHSCTECDFMTIRQRDLERHVKLYHSKTADMSRAGIKTFHCGKCDYQTTNNDALSQHKTRMHKMDKKQFSCNACSYVSAAKDEVERHMLEDHPDIGHSCALCSFKTLRQIDLRKHVDLKHRDRWGTLRRKSGNIEPTCGGRSFTSR
jgi:KRAB domain-containing zinc finger protein